VRRAQVSLTRGSDVAKQKMAQEDAVVRLDEQRVVRGEGLRMRVAALVGIWGTARAIGRVLMFTG
jgi:hypothetical protein